MKKALVAAVALGLFMVCGSWATAQVIDGILDSGYGSALSIQTIETGFGDNENEWNAAYACMNNNTLSLMFTGNLQANFNKLEIFIDSSDAVMSNVYSNPQNNDGTNIMGGMTFDNGFTPDYHIIARRGFDQVNKFDLDYTDIGNQTFSSFIDIASGVNDGFSAVTGTGPGNANPISVGFDNSNVGGIGGNAGAAADQTAAQSVTTGLELQISLADLGNPSGPIRVMLLQNNDNHDFLSNQTLGGLPVGTGNLGSPASAVDFSMLAGDQFFIVNPKPIPEPATAGLVVLGVASLFYRRRR